MIDRRSALMGLGAMFGSALFPPIARAAAGQAAPAGAVGMPVFDAGQRALVAALSERILPTTDTPGAIAAGVPAYIEELLAQWALPADVTPIVEGLAALDARSRADYGVAAAAAAPEPAAPSAPPPPPQPQIRSIGPGGFIRQAPGEQQSPIPPAPPRRLVPAKPSPEIADKTGLLDLNEKICKWPLGHPGEPDFHFCGDPANPGFPYCVAHCGVAYQAQIPRRDRRPPPPLPFGGPRIR
ncbi:MAG: GcrA family cell cycle regulator [Allosphingosinicella sp.]